MASETVYDSRVIADFLIQESLPRGLDPLQVLKLTYIAHGFMLAMGDKPLLEDDVEAWQYGPVVRRVYSSIPGGRSRITHTIFQQKPELETEDARLVKAILDKYGHLSGLTLSDLTHRPGSPWDLTWKTYGKNAVIPQDLIQSHYKRLVEKTREARASGTPFRIAAL